MISTYLIFIVRNFYWGKWVVVSPSISLANGHHQKLWGIFSYYICPAHKRQGQDPLTSCSLEQTKETLTNEESPSSSTKLMIDRWNQTTNCDVVNLSQSLFLLPSYVPLFYGGVKLYPLVNLPFLSSWGGKTAKKKLSLNYKFWLLDDFISHWCNIVSCYMK